MLSRISVALLPCIALAENSYSVATGRHFSFLYGDGVANATGSNEYGQLGIGSKVNQTTLQQVDIASVREVAAGAFHSLVLTASGTVYAAGRNHYGQLGVGSTQDGDGSLQQLSLSDVEAVAAGYAHSLFLTNGLVYAAGLNSVGQLGDDSTLMKTRPVLVFNKTEKATRIAAGYDFSYILTDTNTLYGTGQNLGGQLGKWTRRSLKAFDVLAKNVKAMAAGESHGLYIETTGKLYHTGANFDGQLGRGATDGPHDEWEANTMQDADKIAAGGDSSCIAAPLQMMCMGSNRFGQLGLGGTMTYDSPTAVSEVSAVGGVNGMALADTHSFFIDHDRVMVTGSNSHGELGDGSTTRTNMPKPIFNFDNGVRPTESPTPRPTSAPTPAPTQPPTPAPPPVVTPTREPAADGEQQPWPWEMLILGAVVGLGVVLLLVSCGGSADEGQAADAPPGDSEMVAPA
jgi:alpha-tubulin suppressor-like RCC1 family protein